jgi:hypothetical protein
MSRSLRIVAVTGGLLAGGAVAGAVAAVIAVLIALTVTQTTLGPDWTPLLFVACVGALFGGVLLPITAWLFLRRVPLGLALLGTVLGTIVGGTLGWIVRMGGVNEIQGGVLGSLAGFAVAALLLRLRVSARERRAVRVQG